MKLAMQLRNAEAEQFRALANGGKMRFYTVPVPATADSAASGTLLGEATFGGSLFATASGGVTAAGSTPTGTVSTAGTVAWARILDASNQTVADLVAATDFTANKYAFLAGETITVTEIYYFRPGG